MRRLSKYLLLVVALVLCIVLLPTEAQAATVVDSDICGDNLIWTLDDEGTLTISGTGEMYSYDYQNSPWFQNTAVKKVIIEDGVTTIGNKAFRKCKSLTSIIIPDSVTTIGYWAFSGCDSLTSVTIPDSVTAIVDRAFNNCDRLTQFVVGAENANYSSDGNGILYNKDKTILIQAPNAIQGIVEIPNSVTTIGDSAFFKCTQLTSVTIPDSVTTIGDSAFFECTQLTSVTIPDSVTTIGGGAFQFCNNLTSVTIGNSVTTIGDYAFSDCTQLTNVTIGYSVTEIGEGAFDSCENLTTVNYKGSQEDWSLIYIGPGNHLLRSSTIVYNFSENDHSSNDGVLSTTIIIVACVVGVAAIGGGAALVIIKKKR